MISGRQEVVEKGRITSIALSQPDAINNQLNLNNKQSESDGNKMMRIPRNYKCSESFKEVRLCLSKFERQSSPCRSQ